MSEADLRAEVADLRSRLAEAEAELEDRKQFVAQVMDAEDRARRRIAQLIHDDALQSLLAANQDLMEAAPGREQVMRAHDVVSSTIAQLREAMIALHPVTLKHGGLESALGAVARQAERQGALEVTVQIDEGVLGRNDELVLALARELLANVAKHSGATSASVRIAPLADSIELQVMDDGTGMTADRRREALVVGHIGLASVAQRVEANGGELEIESAPGSGTRVRASCSIKTRRARAELASREAGRRRLFGRRLIVRRLIVRRLDRRGLDNGRIVRWQVDHATRVTRIGRDVVKRLVSDATVRIGGWRLLRRKRRLGFGGHLRLGGRLRRDFLCGSLLGRSFFRLLVRGRCRCCRAVHRMLRGPIAATSCSTRGVGIGASVEANCRTSTAPAVNSATLAIPAAAFAPSAAPPSVAPPPASPRPPPPAAAALLSAPPPAPAPAAPLAPAPAEAEPPAPALTPPIPSLPEIA